MLVRLKCYSALCGYCLEAVLPAPPCDDFAGGNKGGLLPVYDEAIGLRKYNLVDSMRKCGTDYLMNIFINKLPSI